MTKAFWSSWQLWEKLCFILAAAIVVVVFLGCMKLTYNHWKLRKYTKIAETRAAIKQEMTHSQSVKRGRANQIPFGVRALESGVEVDGVWVSRSNTPAGSLPGSPRLSSITVKQTAASSDPSADRKSSASSMSRIEILQPAFAHPEVNLPSGSPLTSHNSFDRPARKHEPPPTSDHQPRGRPTYQPRRSSHLRYSNSFNPEDSEELTALEGQFILTHSKGKRPEGSDSEGDNSRHSASWSGSSSNSGNRGSSSQPNSGASSNGFLHPEYHNPSKGHCPNTYELSDIDPRVIDKHSHMDEMGLLHVTNPLNGMTVVYGPVDDAASNEAVSSSQEDRNPFATPDRSPKAGRDFSFQLDDDIADQHAQLMDTNEIVYDQGHAQPFRPFDGNRRLRRSQVVRKINSGFEILRPGTLDAPRQSNDDTEWKVEGDKRESKKLQKRGRASSRSSYTIEK